MEKEDFNDDQKARLTNAFKNLDSYLGVSDYNASGQLHKLRLRISPKPEKKNRLFTNILGSLFKPRYASVFTFALGLSVSFLIDSASNVETPVYRSSSPVSETMPSDTRAKSTEPFTTLVIKTSEPSNKLTEIIDSAILAKIRVELLPTENTKFVIRLYGVDPSLPSSIPLRALLGLPATTGGNFEISLQD
jgi:hypothetical protein